MLAPKVGSWVSRGTRVFHADGGEKPLESHFRLLSAQLQFWEQLFEVGSSFIASRVLDAGKLCFLLLLRSAMALGKASNNATAV